MTSTGKIVSEILGRLDFAVLERLEGGEFEFHGTPPDWLASFFGISGDPAAESFFLADFLEQAAAEFWRDPSADESVRSGIWEETNAAGESGFFEAIAMKTGEAEVLIVEAADERHNREQMFVQQWHVDTLESRRLGKEIEKKEILLDCIVHDLSNPLATIMVNLQHLEKKIGDEKLRRSIGRALGQAERQRDLIRSIAEVFQSDLSAFDPLGQSPGDAPDIGKVAARIVEAHRETAGERGIELILEDRGGGRRVVGESAHLARIFENLIVNALRHSPENGRVTATLESDPDGGSVEARVEDDGPGVDPEIAETLFKPFVQGQGNAGQSGLGLYFCKMMTDLWGGEIGCRPRLEGGACFWFRLPVISENSAE